MVSCSETKKRTLGSSEDVESDCSLSAGTTTVGAHELTQEDVVQQQHDGCRLVCDPRDAGLTIGQWKLWRYDCSAHEKLCSDVTDVASLGVEHAVLPKHVASVCLNV